MTRAYVNSVVGLAGTETLAASDSLIAGASGLICSGDNDAITSGGADPKLVLNGSVMSDTGDGYSLFGCSVGPICGSDVPAGAVVTAGDIRIF